MTMTTNPTDRAAIDAVRSLPCPICWAGAGADLPRAMFLLGELAGHAQQLLDVLDSVVTP